MDSFNLRVRSRPNIVVPKFTTRRIAVALAESSKARILRGYNIQDQPSKPLTLAYAGRKVKLGKLPIRNWNQTGNMMADYGIQSESDKSVVIGWSPAQRDKVRWNEKWDHMAGLSPRDREAGDRAARAEFKEYVRKIFRVERA